MGRGEVKLIVLPGSLERPSCSACLANKRHCTYTARKRKPGPPKGFGVKRVKRVPSLSTTESIVRQPVTPPSEQQSPRNPSQSPSTDAFDPAVNDVHSIVRNESSVESSPAAPSYTRNQEWPDVVLLSPFPWPEERTRSISSPLSENLERDL